MRRTSFLLTILIVSISSSIAFAQFPQNGYAPSYGYSGVAPVYGYGRGWTTYNSYNPMQNYSHARRMQMQLQMQQMRQLYYQNLEAQIRIRNEQNRQRQQQRFPIR